MESNLFKTASKVATPLSLISVIFVVLYLVYRRVLGLNIFTALAESNTFLLLNSIIDKLFILALVTLVLGIVAYVSVRIWRPQREPDIIERPIVGPPLPKGYKRFSVSVLYGNKIGRIPRADIPGNLTWSEASNAFCIPLDVPQNPEKYKILDVKRGEWLPNSSKVAELKSDSVALVDIDSANSYGNDVTIIAAILRAGK